MSIESYPSPNGVLTSLIWRKTMSGGETSLSGYDNASQALSYTPGQEQVYLNGILLVRGDDYTATNGTSITGLSALAASDFVQINCYNNYSVATTPSTSIVGTIANNQLANSGITINGTSTSLGGTYTNAAGSTSAAGILQLTDSTSSTSTSTAATPNSVKSAYDLANGAIPKTLTTTTGDIIYASGANTPARLGIGSTGQVLGVSGGVPAWGSAPASSHIGVRVKGSSNQGITNTTYTILPFNQETYDTSNFHDTSTNNSRLTIPSGLSGYYYVYANLNWNGGTSGYRRQQIYKNGSTSAFEVDIAFSQDIWMNVHSSTTLYLTAGDYLEMRVYQTSGGTRSIHMGETVGDLTHFGLVYLGA
jgi:hypothetical protein